jgi:hypothetical protein
MGNHAPPPTRLRFIPGACKNICAFRLIHARGKSSSLHRLAIPAGRNQTTNEKDKLETIAWRVLESASRIGCVEFQ